MLGGSGGVRSARNVIASEATITRTPAISTISRMLTSRRISAKRGSSGIGLGEPASRSPARSGAASEAEGIDMRSLPSNEDDDEDDGAAAADATWFEVAFDTEDDGARFDAALARRAPAALSLSRSRARKLIETGAATLDGAVATPSTAVRAGARALVFIPPPEPIDPQPEQIALSVVYEDADLIVVDKPSGMAAHPAPGTPSGTLVNALLAHCGDTLSGVGGAARPGLVHRIDKETTGLLVVAKNDAAHQGLAAQFADHSVERSYLAVCWGVPDRADPRLRGIAGVSWEGGALKIDAPLARHPHDRKKMAVARAGRSGGKRAVTRVWTEARFGVREDGGGGVALLRCRLETGRTHQIRAHASYVGHALVGDPVYGASRAGRGVWPSAAVEALSRFPRQALHAATLGFEHPTRGEKLRFVAQTPEDLAALITVLEPSRA